MGRDIWLGKAAGRRRRWDGDQGRHVAEIVVYRADNSGRAGWGGRWAALRIGRRGRVRRCRWCCGRGFCGDDAWTREAIRVYSAALRAPDKRRCNCQKRYEKEKSSRLFSFQFSTVPG